MNQLEQISKLDGLEFIQGLLEFERQRFDKYFINKPMSVFEEINIDFGLFPDKPAYPVYFHGNIKSPQDKVIFMGINPGYNSKTPSSEQEYFKNKSLFEGYCNCFRDRFKKDHGALIPFFQGIKSFWARYQDISPHLINWDWFQENLINIEFIPYHSADTGGLRINNPEEFAKKSFSSLIKIIEYLNPTTPIFINGYPTIGRFFKLSPLNNYIKVEQEINYHGARKIVKGKILTPKKEYTFIGLPFLVMPAGGYDSIVKAVKQIEAKRTI